MAEKRRDNKNRVLKTGESQRKDGRYMYKYTDIDGKVKYEYSWKLVATDKMPAGKKDEPCLRDKVKEVEKRKEKGIGAKVKKLKVIDIVERSISNRQIRDSTRNTYRTYVDYIRNSPFGNYAIEKVKISTAKEFLIMLQKERGLSCSTTLCIGSILKSAFQDAFEDELLVKNPFCFPMKRILEQDQRKREGMTTEQKEAFLKFVSEDPRSIRYYDMIVVLLETGLRISELSGLTMKDVDMKNRLIHVNHQLSRDGRFVETKSKNGIRSIPMSDRVYASLQNVIRERESSKIVPFSERDSRLVFVTRKGTPVSIVGWGSIFRNISKRWAMEDKAAVHVTPHVCRHTFCTDMVKAGVNIKTVQYLMGHASSEITLDIYTNIKVDDVAGELRRVGWA